MSSRQSYTTLKHEIESLITSNALKNPVSEAMSDNSLMKEIIKAIITAFSPESDKAADLSIILPEKSKGELEQFITNNITKQLNRGLEIKFDKKISSGFKIGPKGEGYHISFTDKDFEELISSYLRPRIREIIFEK
ncbi:V-type proton ATPase subunit E [bioreactor metagenome]|uniref:V-type proton ATPase subunit E n=1 Tax=bioreactor metagenome TaxID=1076179 RepID=A0A645G477_9ZZZZ